MTPEQFEEIHEKALRAAKHAQTLFYLEHGDHHGYCGFAWVDVPRVRSNSKIGKKMLELGYRKPYGRKGLSLWNPLAIPTQCIDIKTVTSNAYAQALRDHGIEALSGSRMD